MKEKNEKTQKRSIRKELMAEMKEHKITFAVYIILRMIVIAAMVLSCINGNYENLFACTLCLVLFLAPAFVEKNLGIGLPSALEVLILLFIFSAEILGEMQSYYTKFPYWDMMLHTLNGFLCAAAGFALLDIVNKNPNTKFKLSPLYLSIVAFCFSMTVGVLWEFFEFGADVFLHTDMQKDYIIHDIFSVKLNPDGLNEVVAIKGIEDTLVNGQSLGVGGYLDIGLIDTMKDLLVNFVGAVVFSIVGFFYVKNRGKGKFAKKFIPYLKEKKK